MVITSCLPRGWLGDEAFPDDQECSCGLAGAPSEIHSPRCDRTRHPYIDEDTLALVERAVESLLWSRGSGPGNAGAVLSALASLIAEAQSRLPDAVADARNQDWTWAEIAVRLATTATTARHRYCHYARWRAGLPVPGN